MKYYKNTELAKLYHVSEKSVRNWIDASKQDKLDLQLYEQAGKLHIANTSKNTALIEKLVSKGKKYKNSRGYKRINPSAKFYEQYDTKQIFDIISNMEVYREIPYQYTYFDGGAQHWNLYTEKLLTEPSSNYLKDIIELLHNNTEYIDQLIGEDTKINIIDIGVGNGLPVRPLLEHFLQRGQLHRYIGIDISSDMLTTAKKNIHTWFGNKVAFEGHVRDVNYDRFDDLLIDDSLEASHSKIKNIVVYFGSTIVNFRKPENSLRIIHDSMGKQDLLLFSLKLDSQQSRRYFDFTSDAPSSVRMFQGKNLIDLLNIDENIYDLEQFFNEKQMMRQTCIRFKVAVSIDFSIEGKHRSVELNKGDSILLWRAKHLNLLQTLGQLDLSGFETLQATRSLDEEHLMTVSKIAINE